MVFKHFISGTIPSKKNSRITNTKTGRTFPSKKFQQWHRTQMLELFSVNLPSPFLHCQIELDIRYPTLAVADNTNKAESVMDLLVDAGILLDDNWKVVPRLVLTGRHDKQKPGCFITITSMETT